MDDHILARWKPPKLIFLTVSIILLAMLKPPLASAGSYTLSYRYDDLNRLELTDYGNDQFNLFTYDEVGNIEISNLNVPFITDITKECTGGTVTLTTRTYLSGEDVTCVGSLSITADTGVTINSGATVVFRAPMVILGPGFSVKAGGTFNAGQQ